MIHVALGTGDRLENNHGQRISKEMPQDRGAVNATRESVPITRNGRPVVKLVPIDKEAKDFLGCLAGVIEIVGDIESPIEPPKAWEALW
jgi:hypothetical protein